MLSIKIKKIKKTHSGIVKKTNPENKKLLIVDFSNKCAYCDDHDKYSGGPRNYHVEHFAPKKPFIDLQFDYDNLLYSCSYCNISKSNTWVGRTASECIVGNQGFVSPCDDSYYSHLSRHDNGKIKWDTELGKFMYYNLKLYLLRHEIIYNLERVDNKIIEIKGIIEKDDITREKKEILIEFYKELTAIFYEYYSELFLSHSLSHS